MMRRSWTGNGLFGNLKVREWVGTVEDQKRECTVIATARKRKGVEDGEKTNKKIFINE